jgi:DNA invertase Pin-like site-specific DNA recombinase
MGDKALTTTEPQITVAYMRTATAERVESRISLARQQDACEDFAHSLGARITRTYFDVGVSGLSEQRPALTQLMRDLAHGQIRRVVIADPARLARSRELEQRLQQRIRSEGATISSPCDSRGQLPGRTIDDTTSD